LTIDLFHYSQTPTYRSLSAVTRDFLDGADKPHHVGIIDQLSTDTSQKTHFIGFETDGCT
jgi:hypothetical protein